MNKFNYQIFDSINQIDTFLEDDISQIVFRQRILANFTKDLTIIHDMLKYTKKLDVKQAYDSYMELDEHYGLYKNPDVLAWLGSKKEKKDIVLFGAGRNVKNYLSILSVAEISVRAIVDNRSTLTHINDVPVMNVADNANLLRNAYIIITPTKYRDEIYQQLKDMDIAVENIFYPEKNALMSYSRDVYFDTDIWTMRKDEIFIDAGCYNLFTSYEFSRYCPDYQKIYAFEPDEMNYELCKQNQTRYGLKNVEIVNAGLWENESILKFSHKGDLGAGACVAESGETEVKVVSLDKVLAGNPCTMIKMDIEGAELSALKGAAQTIKKWKPRLAICVYHKPEDIIDIPLYIKSLVPEYKIKIRHYSTYFYDTVLYAYVE